MINDAVAPQSTHHVPPVAITTPSSSQPGGPTPSPWPTPAHTRLNSRWQPWEKGFLIARLLVGTTVERIAADLTRTADSVQSELNRLLAGRTSCPAEYTSTLAKIAESMRARRATRPTRSRQATASENEQVAAQQRALSLRLDRIEQALGDGISAALIDLAVAVADKRVEPGLLGRYLTERAATGVHRLALAIAGKASTESAVGANCPPLVLLGPGGEYCRPWPPAPKPPAGPEKRDAL